MKSDPKVSPPLKTALRSDVLANFVGKGATIGLLLVCTPLYLKFAGLQAFALISFATTLQSVIVLFDFGLGTTINRILATARVRGVGSAVAAAAFRLERWSIGITLASGAFSLACLPTFLPDWLQVNPESLPSGKWVFLLMSVAVVTQLPATFYSGALNGLGQQQMLNWFTAIMAFVKFVGSAILLDVSPRLDWFFAWQAGCNITLALLLRSAYLKYVAFSYVNTISEGISLRKHIPYALGVGATAAMGVVLTQLDKILLSRLLPLAEFGYYMLGWALCSGIFMCALPVTTACFPRLTSSVNSACHMTQNVFNAGCQIIAAAAIPVAGLIIVFPQHILAIWTGQNASVENGNETVSLLVLGAMLNVLCQMPHALLLAHGKSRVGLLANTIMVVLIVPLLIFSVGRYGLIGAGWTWVALNAAYLFVGNSLILMWLLPGHLGRWFTKCVAIPITAVFVPTISAAIFISVPVGRSLSALVLLCSIYIISLIGCCLSMRTMRNLVWSHKVRSYCSSFILISRL